MTRQHKSTHKYRHIGIEFGRRLEQLRKQRGLTQKQLAAALHVSSAMVCQIEKGQRPNVNLAHIWAFAEALHLSPAELLVPSAFVTHKPAPVHPLAARIANLVQREVEEYVNGVKHDTTTT